MVLLGNNDKVWIALGTLESLIKTQQKRIEELEKVVERLDSLTCEKIEKLGDSINNYDS